MFVFTTYIHAFGAFNSDWFIYHLENTFNHSRCNYNLRRNRFVGVQLIGGYFIANQSD